MIYLRSGNWLTERDNDKIVYRGYVEPSGTLDRPLDALTCVGQGTVGSSAITGTMSAPLGALTAAATGNVYLFVTPGDRLSSARAIGSRSRLRSAYVSRTPAAITLAARSKTAPSRPTRQATGA